MTRSAPRRLVAAIALVDDFTRPTRVLAARRTRPPALSGRWEFPGGKVEPGEGARTAAAREAVEELGIRVLLGEQIGVGAWPLTPGLEMELFLAVLADGSPPPVPVDGHDRVRWLTADQLDEVPWLDTNRAIVAEVARHLQ